MSALQGPGRLAGGARRLDTLAVLFPGDVAEWLRSGLQSRLHRFDSGRRLYLATLVLRAPLDVTRSAG
jgi:hypothetical protein